MLKYGLFLNFFYDVNNKEIYGQKGIRKTILVFHYFLLVLRDDVYTHVFRYGYRVHGRDRSGPVQQDPGDPVSENETRENLKNNDDCEAVAL